MTEIQATGRFEEARQLFVDGLVCFETGRFEDAEQCFLASLRLLPGRVSTLVNLAATQIKLSRSQDALGVADQVLTVEPDNLDAWFHRGAALGHLGRHAEALACYEKVLALDGRLAEPWLRHGQTLQSLDRHATALDSYARALAIDPALTQAWINRGGILREMNRLDEAAHAFRQAIAHGADPELGGYYLASVGGGVAPAAAPVQYVEPLFDDYAPQFDEHLVQALHYRAHKVLAENLAGLAPGRFSSALDLGCGTGLCGPLVKPMAGRLSGVDLSGRMIERARTLGVYEHLAHADIVEYLRTTDETYDLILAADVFIYVGDLAPVFAAVRRVLAGAGVFCFSAEIGGRDGQGYQLLPSLRYAHSEPYLRDLAAQHRFEIVKWLHQSIRDDQRQPIDGVFVYLTRPL